MFRVARAPAVIPTGVDVKVNDRVTTTKGKNGELTRTLDDAVAINHTGNALTFGPRDGYADGWIQAGTAHALLNAMVVGVTRGSTKKLQLVGVGYRAVVKGNIVDLALGFSHPVDHQLSAGVTTKCPSQIEIVLKDADRQLTGQVAADLHACHRPESYKGKSVRYANEVVYTGEAKKRQGNTMNKKSARICRAVHAHRKLQELGTTRLTVHRIPCRVHTQVIAPNGSGALVVASAVEKAIVRQLGYTGNKNVAAVASKAVVEHTLEKGIKDVSFGHSGLQYHGCVQALTDAVREAGLQF